MSISSMASYRHSRREARTPRRWARGYVARKSFAALRALDAGQGERIPTLREVFETVSRAGFINIELKGKRTAAPVTGPHPGIRHESRLALRGFMVSSSIVANCAPSMIPRSPSPAADASTRLHALSARRCGPRRESRRPFCDGRFVQDAHRRGLRVFAYTVNAPSEIARLPAWARRGFTDFPERWSMGEGNSPISGSPARKIALYHPHMRTLIARVSLLGRLPRPSGCASRPLPKYERRSPSAVMTCAPRPIPTTRTTTCGIRIAMHSADVCNVAGCRSSAASATNRAGRTDLRIGHIADIPPSAIAIRIPHVVVLGVGIGRGCARSSRRHGRAASRTWAAAARRNQRGRGNRRGGILGRSGSHVRM